MGADSRRFIYRIDYSQDVSWRWTNGPIVSQVKVYIGPEDDAATLYEKVCRAGLELFRQTLPSFLDESFVLKEQLEADSTYQPRGEPFGGQVNNVWNSKQKNRFQRAFTFPPFRGYRLPPSNIGDTPNVGTSSLTPNYRKFYCRNQRENSNLMGLETSKFAANLDLPCRLQKILG